MTTIEDAIGAMRAAATVLADNERLYREKKTQALMTPPAEYAKPAEVRVAYADNAALDYRRDRDLAEARYQAAKALVDYMIASAGVP